MTGVQHLQWALTALLLIVAFAGAFFLGRRLGLRRASPPSRDEKPCFEQMRDAALVTEYGRIVEANSAAAGMFGYSREALLGLPVSSLLAEPEAEQQFVTALADGEVVDYEMRLRTASGETRECLVTASARYDESRRLVGCRGVARDVTERNRMIAELRNAELDYRGLFENAYDAILVLEPQTEVVLDANHRACTLYDVPREQLLGRSMLEFSVDPRTALDQWDRTRRGTRFATFESQHFRSDGSVIDVEINAGETYYRGRRVILSINRDVTVRRRAENVLRESEERLRLLLESVTDYAIVMLDPSGHVISWNEAAERIMGYAAGEVLGKSAAMFLPAEEQSSLAERLGAAEVGSALARQVTRIRKDGGRFAASVVLKRVVDDTGALRGYAEIVHDVTARAELDKAPQEVVNILRQVANEWTSTFDAVQVPILVLDANGEIRRLNRAAQMLAGRPFDRLIHTPVRDLPGEPWQTIGQVAGEAFAGNVHSVRARDGEAVWQVSTSIAGAPDAPRAIVVAYDLTLVTQLEASVRQNEVAAALGSLVAGVAHEVRNPLFTISATLDAWEARYGRTEGIERYAVGLREQVDRLNRLMRDLLEYGKPNPLVFADVSLADVICSAAADCATLAAQQGVELVLDLVDLPPVAIDGGRMEQVFLNVVDNAIRHSPAGAVVRIVSAVEGAYLVCRVVDEGPGLGAQDPDSIFAPMYTRRRGGTGLGLPIARNIVTAHGGTISVASRQDGPGAVATIRLPLERSLGQERRSA